MEDTLYSIGHQDGSQKMPCGTQGEQILVSTCMTAGSRQVINICFCNQYVKPKVFTRILVSIVAGDCGNIGGNFSHEYHYQAAIGEDTLLLCNACGVSTNSQLVSNPDDVSCTKCGNQLTKVMGIEVCYFLIYFFFFTICPLFCPFFINYQYKLSLQVVCRFVI